MSTPTSTLPPELDPRAARPSSTRNRAARRVLSALPEDRDRRTATVLVALAGVGLLLLVGIGAALSGASRGLVGAALSGVPAAVGDAVTGSDPSPSTAPSPSAAAPSASASATGVVTPVGVAAYDPGGDGSEHDAEVRLATDGDPATAWTTDRYRTAALGGLKDGVGLVLDLGSPTAVGAVEVTLGAPGTRVQLRTGDSLDALTAVATADRTDGTVVLRPAQPVTARYAVVWLTQLGPAGSGFRGEVSEVVVRS